MIAPSNLHLPAQTTSFIGRDDEILEIAQRLSAPDCHLLTLVGPGGIGKTRLAIEVAKCAAEKPPAGYGVFFVDLQPLNTSDLLITTLADTTGMKFYGEQPPRIQLFNYLRERHLLLIIDNFEHLLDAVDLLTDIVKTAPSVKLLVTSREALNVQEEWLWQVGGLQVPDNGSSVEDYSAVQLFVERARHVRADFTPVGQEIEIARICQLVDGMPLALELAAGWTKTISCREISSEIQQGLDFLTTRVRNVPERHRSIRAVFERSWHLLTDEERFVFPGLSVFRGGFRREAAEVVAGASLSMLAGLVDKSLLRADSPGRYDMQELVRQFGETQLDRIPGAKSEAQDRHCDYYADFLNRRRIELKGAQQIAALDMICDEIDNVRAGWQWAVEHSKELQIEQSLHSLVLYHQMRSKSIEGEQLLKQACDLLKHVEKPFVGALILAWNFLLTRRIQPTEPNLVRKALSLLTINNFPEETAFTMMGLYKCSGIALIEYVNLLQKSVEYFRAQSQIWGVAWCLTELADTSPMSFLEAESYFKESVQLFNLAGDQWAKTWSLGGLGLLKEKVGAYQDALPLYEERLAICQAIGDIEGVLWTLPRIANVALMARNYEAAHKQLKSWLEIAGKIPLADRGIKWTLNVLGQLAMREGKITQVVQICARVREHYRTVEGQQQSVERINGILEHLAGLLPLDVFLRALKDGESRELKSFLVEYLAEAAPSQPQSTQPLSDPLSQRELEVLRLMAAGLKNREIAQKLVVAPGTIKAHTSTIYRKLGVTSRIQAVAYARELNLL